VRERDGGNVMSDPQEERGLYERIQEMDADVKWLEESTINVLDFDPVIARLRENVNVLLGEGDVWKGKP